MHSYSPHEYESVSGWKREEVGVNSKSSSVHGYDAITSEKPSKNPSRRKSVSAGKDKCSRKEGEESFQKSYHSSYSLKETVLQFAFSRPHVESGLPWSHNRDNAS
jgi:hypothetical protein